MRSVVFICLLFSTPEIWAHDYFFAFAELEYKKSTGIVEATLIVTTHDFEHYLHQQGWSAKDLISSQNDSLSACFIQNEINKHFHISTNIHDSLNMQLIGFETKLIGTTQFYLTTQIEPIQSIDFKFDLLMDVFPEQQNKLNFICKESDMKTTLEFLPSRKKQHVDLY
jgi:hypothetical protein